MRSREGEGSDVRVFGLMCKEGFGYKGIFWFYKGIICLYVILNCILVIFGI